MACTRLRLAVLLQWNLDQKSLSIRCGIDNGKLSHYLNGHDPISPTHRAILAHVLKVEPWDLDGWIDPGLWKQVAS